MNPPSTHISPLARFRRAAWRRGVGAFLAALVTAPFVLAQPVVTVLQVDGVIDPVIAAYVRDGITAAARSEDAAVVIQLNTPGGLLDATRSLVEAMVNTDIPVVVFVSPRAARATSAGVFITMAADIAAMAPQTHLGAAHPVNIGGSPGRQEQTPREDTGASAQDESDKDAEKRAGEPKGPAIEEKMVSDAVAWIRGLAEGRGRNADWAEKAVRESASLTATEAVEENVVDLIASGLEDLLEKIDGRTIEKNGRSITLDVKEAPIKHRPMSAIQRFLHHIAHPNIAYILLMLGVYGLIYEFSSPGIGFGGVVGVICLLLAFFALQVLPINLVGLLLIIFGILLFITDLFTPTGGLLSIGGVLAFIFGSFMLIDVQRGVPIQGVSWTLVLPTALATAGFFGIVVRKVLAARRAKPQVGAETIVGAEGRARTPIAPDGQVFLQGELWSARADEPIAENDPVIVVAQDGNFLIVRKK